MRVLPSAFSSSHQQGQDQPGEHRREHAVGHAGEHLAHGAHRAQVGADVHHVGGQQQRARGPQQPARIVAAQHAREPLAGDLAHPGAHELHGDHQRQEEHRRPQQPEAELRR
jgi:hypothetical protein